MQLDQVWWLVSPQNPLKNSKNMAAFEKRFAGAKKMARHPKIVVSDLERKFNTIYTYDTIKRLKLKFPSDDFILIIGADNLAQMPLWWRWRDIFRQMPVAVFDRGGFFPKVLSGKAASYFAKYRKNINNFYKKPIVPGWTFLQPGKKDISSTRIRSK